MIRKYKLSIWKSDLKEWEDVEFEAETASDEPKKKAIEIYRERNLDHNCFLYVWVPKGDPQFVKKDHETWKSVSYFAAAYKEEFFKRIDKNG